MNATETMTLKHIKSHLQKQRLMESVSAHSLTTQAPHRLARRARHGVKFPLPSAPRFTEGAQASEAPGQEEAASERQQVRGDEGQRRRLVRVSRR